MKKVGILGGGQLGRMLLQAAANYPVITYIMEKDEKAPAAHLCHHFIKGDITNFEAVYEFGKKVDALTIEIENVNIEALEKLEQEGLPIFPRTQALKILKNKISQKQFYGTHQIPTSPFKITHSISELNELIDFFPAVHKLALGGYDGKGVAILNSKEDIIHGFDMPALLEKKIDIVKEIAIIIAVSNSGETAIYPPIDMVFDKKLHLLLYQICPADIKESILWKAEAISLSVVKKLNSPGIFAIEMFVDKDENVLVNEIAPRVHNSGHHTIEGHYSSQFDMVWRILLDYPLGNTEMIMSSALVNLVGANDFQGAVRYVGLDKILAMDNVFIHLYGKETTQPGRKMGHVTILSNEKQELLHKAHQIHHTLFVQA